MKNKTVVCGLFIIAALYDGLLGIGFLCAGPTLLERFQVTPPNHFGYIHFPAALLIVFALMFAAVARNPIGNRNLIPYGMLLKVSYCGVTFYHWFSGGIPDIWKPFAVLDVVFLVAFVWAYGAIASLSPEGGNQRKPAR